MEVKKRHGSDFNRVFDILKYQDEKYPNDAALNVFRNNSWHPLSIKEIRKRCDAISQWLQSNRFTKGDKVVIVPVVGSPEWMLLDFACQQVGMITVPVHPTSKNEEIEAILKETEARLVIAADEELYRKFKAVAAVVSTAISVAHLETGKDGFFGAIELKDTADLRALEHVRSGIHEDDVLMILYTSGSSGTSKGVVLTHHNVVHNIKAILSLVPLEPGDKVLSFLPFSHVFERATCYAYLAFGVSLYFNRHRDTFTEDFRTIKPVFCTCVPRVLEKMYDYLEDLTLGKNKLKRRIIIWAMAVGKKYEFGGKLRVVYSFKLMIAKLLVLGHWRRMLGGRMNYMVVGAASLRADIGKLFSAAGIHVVEGYGMTETAPLITINRFEPGLTRYGTVGMTIPGIDVRIDEPNEGGEGEILVKGPNVMQGYFKRPELTQSVFTDDGWFRTGDIGKFVDQRFLKITDRKKDIFKTSAGKYVAPLPLQNLFKTSPFIERCLIIGFQRPFVTALIVPRFSRLESWCLEQGIHWTSPPFMIHNIKVRTKFKEEVDRLNEELPNFERVRDFVLCHEDWTVERGEITATMKPVRQSLMENYNKEIEKMYS
jgi:long-chain acyl-CoA synthetase